MSSFIDVCRSYKGQPHQDAALLALQKTLPQGAWDIFLRDWRKKEPGPQGIVTPELMHRLTGHRADSFDKNFCDDANRLFHETGFDKHPQAQAMLMANMMHETANFVFLKELASGSAYNNRRDLANGPHDGPRFKGAGVLQLTGRVNYQHLADDLHDPRVMDGVDYVANRYPFMSAKSWIQRNHLLDVCLTQGFDACCRKINGGTNGWADRHQKYQICLKYMT